MTRFFTLIAALLSFATASALSFEGAELQPVQITSDASSGIEELYVLASTAGVRAVYPAAGAHWSVFGSAGAAYAEPVEGNSDGSSSTLDLSGLGSCGLLIEDAGRQHCYWIVDYSASEMTIGSIAAVHSDNDCDFMQLDFDGRAEPIYYYSINGRRIEISRDITASYTSLVYNEAEQRYDAAEQTLSLAALSAANHLPAPLCDTRVSIAGDRFLRAWGRELHAETGTYTAVAVAATTSAEQAERDVDNEQRPSGGEALGGSAPCDITFTAAVTDAAVFTEWQISRDPEFGILENSYNDLVITPTFTDQGTLYVRFTCANADATCSYTSDVYTVSIGESKLECPNAFTPDTSPGVNDEWKVSYQSIVEFKCDIFNRWGTRLATLTDPSQGWDGKHGGKSVGPGVYYYVIRARGADGKAYNLSGDINIVGSSRQSNYTAE